MTTMTSSLLTTSEVDHRILVAARQKARTEFDQERSLAPGSEAAAEKIKYALEVAKVLREEVLQGEPVEGQKDRYRTKLDDREKNTLLTLYQDYAFTNTLC
jgi:hypothetical protein